MARQNSAWANRRAALVGAFHIGGVVAFCSYMKPPLLISLRTSAEQAEKLRDLQTQFAAVCNALAPLAQRTACWNRVALHHLSYRAMREQFPAMGSQMVCNAVYSVSRACRLIYQHPQSPFNLQRLGGKSLPLLHFQPDSPVYFDRHTLSLKDGQASIYTLDGRIRFQLPLAADDERNFRLGKLREVVLIAHQGGFALRVHIDHEEQVPEANGAARQPVLLTHEVPQYLMVQPGPDLPSRSAAQVFAEASMSLPHRSSRPARRPRAPVSTENNS